MNVLSLANLFKTKTLKILDTSTEVKVTLQLDVSYKFINFYCGGNTGGNKAPIKIASIFVDSFTINCIQDYKISGQNDSLVIMCKRTSETSLELQILDTIYF